VSEVKNGGNVFGFLEPQAHTYNRGGGGMRNTIIWRSLFVVK